MTLLVLTRRGGKLDFVEAASTKGIDLALRLALHGIEVAVVRNGRVVRCRRKGGGR